MVQGYRLSEPVVSVGFRDQTEGLGADWTEILIFNPEFEVQVNSYTN